MAARKKPVQAGKLTNELFRSVTRKILDLADKGTLIGDYLREILTILVDISGCQRVEIIISDLKNYYRFAKTKSGKSPFSFEPLPAFLELPKNFFPSKDKIDVDLLEKSVFINLFDKSSPSLTLKGGILINSTLSPEGFKIKRNGRLHKINPAIETRFKSILMLPILYEEEKLGVLALFSEDKGSLDEDAVSFYQGIADMTGIARAHRQAKVNLRERIKELTCIFQITKLGAVTEKSLGDVLRGAVELIPPAFLYPEAASCVIEFDKKSYKSKGYETPKYRLSSDICIEGKKRGFIEVAYSKELPTLDKGPFLKEELSLVDAVVRELSLIIERKQAEEEKASLHRQLLHADRLVTIGQLTAGVAHELNEPLAGILGFAQFVQRTPNLPEQADKDVQKIIKAALHAREIIKKLMLFSRQTPPEKAKFNLNERVKDGLYLLESRINKSGIKLVKNLDPDLPDITVDPSQLNQVLVNLVVNALQAMPNGGTLTIETKFIVDKVVLAVQDTGVGIPKDNLDRIFIPFFTTKGINEGTGLGLPVVLGIVTAHGGKITVHSEAGKGARFEVIFPVNNSNMEKSNDK